MRVCSSAPTTSKRAGASSSRYSMPGPMTGSTRFRFIPRAARGRWKPPLGSNAPGDTGGPSDAKTNHGKPANMQIDVLADADGFARHVADWLLGLALERHGDFGVVLSGGSTPRPIYELL